MRLGEGVVELDACVMDGTLGLAGSVASIKNIKNPSQVALKVMDRTDHVILVAEGAYRFARAHGFKHDELLTDKARKAWLKWKENLSDKDDWLPDGGTITFSADGLKEIIPFSISGFDADLVTDGGWVDYADANF